MQRFNSKTTFFVIIGVTAAIVLCVGGSLAYKAYSANTPPATAQTPAAIKVQKQEAVQINCLTALPVADWAAQEAARYNNEKHKVDDAVVTVKIIPMDGTTALSDWMTKYEPLPEDADALNLTPEQKDQVKNFPSCWIADSRYLVTEVDNAFQTKYNLSYLPNDGEYRARPLLTTPLVWTALESRAKALEKTYFTSPSKTTLSWIDIHDSVVAQNGWVDLNGQAEWLFFKPVIPRADRYLTGRAAILSAIGDYSHTNKIDSAKLLDPQFSAWLKDIYSGVTDVAASNRGAEDMALMGAGYGDVGLFLEADALQNAKGIQKSWEPIKIYYPEFISWFDYPFSIWTGIETTALQKNAALDFQKYLLAETAQKDALTYGFRPTNSNVSVMDASVPGNLFVAWKDIGVEEKINRANVMRNPDWATLDAVNQWFNKNILKVSR